MSSMWWAVGAVSVVMAGWFGWVALRRVRTDRFDRDAVNRAIYRQRREEIRAEAAGSETVGEALATELGLALLDAEQPPEVAEDVTPDAPLRRSVVLGGAAVFVLASLLLYARWGEPDAPAMLDVGAILQRDASASELARAAMLLGRRVDRVRDDVDSWYYLGHVRLRQSNFAGAAEAFAIVHGLGGAGIELDVAWAQARYLADGGAIAAETRAIIDRVLTNDSDHPVMLEMLSMDAVRRGDLDASVRHLERALGQPLPPERRGLYEQAIARARSQMDADRPRIELTVTIEEGSDRPAWLMVFARPAGGGMPRAVVRRPAQASQTIVLDDALSMSPAAALSTAGSVIVTARASSRGGATAMPGDWEVVSEPVDARDQPKLELALNRPASAAAGSSVGVAVEVVIADGIELPSATPVFVIARIPAGSRPPNGSPTGSPNGSPTGSPNGPPTGSPSGPPLAVRRLVAGDLPTRIVLTDGDAMLPGRSLAGLETVEVLARAALSGSASARPGDLESDWAAATVSGDTVSLSIYRRVSDD